MAAPYPLQTAWPNCAEERRARLDWWSPSVPFSDLPESPLEFADISDRRSSTWPVNSCYFRVAQGPQYVCVLDRKRKGLLWIVAHDYNCTTSADAAGVEVASVSAARDENIAARFRKLADEWEREVGNVSSVSVMTSHPKYREIVGLGWDVVPYLLSDLKNKRGFWFTALYEITKIRPFDPHEAGNSKRMMEAWLNWGRLNKIKF